MADDHNSVFIMHGARAAIGGGMLHIEEQVKAIERAVVENPGLAFDLAKTLIESTCQTILKERKIDFISGEELPVLFKYVVKNLNLVPKSLNITDDIDKSLKKTVNGLQTAVQGVCELRNKCTFASHGSDGPRPKMDTVQALLVAQTADTIVGFLHRIHMQDYLPPSNLLDNYESNSNFNDYVDDIHGMIRIFDVEFRPSEVLFRMEPQTYRVYFAEYEPEPNDNESNVDEEKEESGESCMLAV